MDNGQWTIIPPSFHLSFRGSPVGTGVLGCPFAGTEFSRTVQRGCPYIRNDIGFCFVCNRYLLVRNDKSAFPQLSKKGLTLSNTYREHPLKGYNYPIVRILITFITHSNRKCKYFLVIFSKFPNKFFHYNICPLPLFYPPNVGTGLRTVRSSAPKHIGQSRGLSLQRKRTPTGLVGVL